ncbi:hypothetical protein EG328_005235 [Venturia inaequalis]|uniref:Uncharacterized protein n=1 Tax=Venturia inaequalis TaxID=5025 RepID=A0A8H3VDQ6_VENIN|nr:hypothetical protein EG328_005235 [Venturia inaequalis]RDI81913.1 hypothetical protein Vi05172_g8017 [Venturia inaequalis]
MPEKDNAKKREKQARDDALMAAIALSIGLDGSMNSAMADPSPSPSQAHTRTSSTMPEKDNAKKREKQARDDAFMAAIALSVGLDGSINSAMADSSPSPSQAHTRTSSIMPEKDDDKKREKQALDDALMAAIALSVGLDGSINSAMADPSPSPRRASKPVNIATITGLAKAGKRLKHSLATGVEALALMPDPSDRTYWKEEKEGAEETAAEDGRSESEKTGTSGSPGVAETGSVPVPAVDDKKK